MAALRHPDDLLRVGTSAQSVLRPLELTAGVGAVLSSPIFGAGIDRQRVSAFGVSLGGVTVLAAAGGRMNGSLSAEHSVIMRRPILSFAWVNWVVYRCRYGSGSDGQSAVCHR